MNILRSYVQVILDIFQNTCKWAIIKKNNYILTMFMFFTYVLIMDIVVICSNYNIMLICDIYLIFFTTDIKNLTENILYCDIYLIVFLIPNS